MASEDNSQLERARRIAAEALAREPGARNEYLAESCGEDTELRDVVNALIQQLESTAMWGHGGADVTIAPADKLPGLRCGDLVAERYELREQLGRGAFGFVWKAWDRKLQAFVAIKLVQQPRSSSGELASVLGEARSCFPIKHRNVIRVMDAGRSGDTGYIAMQLCGDVTPRRGSTAEDRSWIDVGTSLADRGVVDGKPALSPHEVARLFVQICSGVSAAHAAGVLHCDLKPGNVLVTPSGVPLVTDFGLSQSYLAPIGTGRATPDGTITLGREEGGPYGTPHFMPPEQAIGREATPRSDVWGLGAILYTMLCGRPPFVFSGQYSSDQAWDIVEQVKRDSPMPLLEIAPNLPLGLAQICNCALSRQPKDRYGSVDALRTAVIEWLGETPAERREVRAGPLLPFSRILVGLLLVIYAFPALLAAWSLVGNWDDPVQAGSALARIVVQIIILLGAAWIARLASRSHRHRAPAARAGAFNLWLSGLIVLAMSCTCLPYLASLTNAADAASERVSP